MIEQPVDIIAGTADRGHVSNAYPKQATNAIPFVMILSVKYSPTVFS